MVHTNEVYGKIKEMSTRARTNPRPQIMIQAIAQELRTVSEQLLPSLHKLKEMRLIQFDGRTPAYVKLTLLGYTATN